MSQGPKPSSLKATVFLAVATLFWAASFPAMRALGLHQSRLAPGVNTMFLSALSICSRFAVGGLVLIVWRGRDSFRCTRAEWRQGAGLGLFGGLGILLQMDGVIHIDASVSAFLTQCYCIWIPLLLAIRHRAWPSLPLLLSCVMVLAGVGILANLDLRNFHLGLGETETILASVLFTGQILLLERPEFADNRAIPVTLLMFALTALLALPVAVVAGHGWSQWKAVYSTPAAVGLTLFLGTACTVIPYTLMNLWQQHLPATQASLIYTCEPLGASVFALFVPAWLSTMATVNYPNETISPHLLLGGGLVIAANLLVLWRSSSKPR
jgi:drug/metabolite transporter (DMT)-like permease